MKEWFEGRELDPVPLRRLPGWLVGVGIAVAIGALAGVVVGAAYLSVKLF